MNSIERLTARARALAARQNPVPPVVLTLTDGTKTPPMLWTDAAIVALDGGAVGVECDNADIEALLRALGAGETETN